jgi:hypothetical protein
LIAFTDEETQKCSPEQLELLSIVKQTIYKINSLLQLHYFILQVISFIVYCVSLLERKFPTTTLVANIAE